MKADLHIHSTVSDGSDSIEQIINIAKEKALDVIAITEHDTLSHMTQIPNKINAIGVLKTDVSKIEASYKKKTNLKVICGVEISAVYKKTNTRTHVLGYSIKRPKIVTAFTEPILKARNKNSEKQIEVLIQNGFKINIDELKRADGKYLYKQHIMDWLVTTGQAPDMFGEFYKKTFKQGGICHFDIEYPSVFEAIQVIKEAGGLAVLAHPGQQQNFWLIPELVACGLDGLELNHHSHSKKDKEIIQNFAREYRLFMTGGSDYHGKYEPQTFGIGDFLSDESGVRAIC
ncbi:MAG: PHP domain-containing protein [Ruminococcaceae bacterium]|nr:PHP domain-containing protein [Oscillospiraceae bacterium]